MMDGVGISGLARYNRSSEGKAVYACKERVQLEVTAQEVAEWMVNEIKFKGVLRQEDAIAYIRAHFGEEHVFQNETGNNSLSKDVKKAFRKLHNGRVAWERDGFFWAWT